MSTATIEAPRIVSQAEWLEARKELLAKEKELTRQHEDVIARRGAMPWVKVEKDYVFDGPKGKVTLGDLFEGRSQLVIYHFMLGPDWEEGCKGCSFLADHIDAARLHVIHHDVAVAVVSRGPVEKIEAFKKRMNWYFPWVSSGNSDFNYDYHVSFTPEQVESGRGMYNFEETEVGIDELPGASVFAKNEQGEIFHTYSAYARGCEQLIGAYHFLEMTPKGRNEHGENQSLGDWVKHHDRYDDAASSEPGCGCGSEEGAS